MRSLILLFLFTGCTSYSKWYRVSCNKHKGGTALTREELIRHIDKHGFKCRKNPAAINRIKNKRLIYKLEKLRVEGEV